MANGQLTRILDSIRRFTVAHAPLNRTPSCSRTSPPPATRRRSPRWCGGTARWCWASAAASCGNAHDAEDAFQATFLVLARKAGSIRRGGSLAAGCTGSPATSPARPSSTKTNAGTGKREAQRMADRNPKAAASSRQLLPLLDDGAGGALPAKYRRPLILCYLQGKTHAEAARELRCPVVQAIWDKQP